MKTLLLIPFACGIAMLGTSCYSHYPTPHAQRSAVIGGLVGAGAGALIGEHNDRELEGAAVGGAIGAITGGLLGSARDQEYYGPPYGRTVYRSYPVARPYPYRTYGSSYRYGHRYHGHYPRHHSHSHHRRSSSYCR